MITRGGAHRMITRGGAHWMITRGRGSPDDH